MKKITKVLMMVVVFLGMNLSLAADFGAGVISVSPTAFQPKNWLVDTLSWYAYGDELYFTGGPDGEVWVYAPVFLPNLSTITSFTAVVTDNGSGIDDEIRVVLNRHNMLTGAIDNLAYLLSPGSFASPARYTLTDTTISYAQVDNETYAYYVGVMFYSPRSYLKFHGLKIQYWSVL